MQALGRRPSFAVPNPALRQVAPGRPTLRRRKGKITGLNSRDCRALPNNQAAGAAAHRRGPAWGYANMAKNQNHPAEARFAPKTRIKARRACPSAAVERAHRGV